jgi:hypothetical protein
MATSQSLFNRMFRAAQVKPALYEEVEADATATGQALLVVALTSIAAGIGTGFGALSAGGTTEFFYGLLFGLAGSIAGWLVWALFAYIFGVSILKGPKTSSTWGELLRTMGFASSPGVLRIFGFIPGLGSIIVLVASVWTLVATVVAIRQALDFSTWRAILTALIGWIAYTFLSLLVLGIVGGGSAPITL